MDKISHIVCTVLTVLLSAGTAAKAEARITGAELPIAIERYSAEEEIVGEQPLPGAVGYKIVHRNFDVELEDRISNVPILAIQHAGLHHASVEARAKCVAERLIHALDLMKTEKGARLLVMRDDWNAFTLERSSSEPTYAVFLAHSSLKTTPLRIITLYSEDVRRFPWVGTSREMAEYVKAVIRAHQLLFWKRSGHIAEYEDLMIDQRTREGKIFKEIMIRAKERASMMKRQTLTVKDIKDALSRVAMSQRHRLVRMAVTAPRDWPEGARR